MAIAISKSGMFAVKTPEAALALLLIADAEGVPPAQAMMDYDIISGRPALKSAAMLARFQRSGGTVQWGVSTDEKVEGKFSHPRGGELVVTWDTARLKTAGLADREMHKKFPMQMKRARCISEAIRAIAPQCIPLGMYTVEETRDIEVDMVPQTENNSVASAVAQITHGLSQDEVDALVMTMDVKALPELKTAFAAAWKSANGDEKAQARLKNVYDQHKADLEAQVVI
jgi:hypothetical protein